MVTYKFLELKNTEKEKNKLYELRAYPDAYDDQMKKVEDFDNGKYHLVWKYVTIDSANELIDTWMRIFHLQCAPTRETEDEVGNMFTSDLTDDSIAESLAGGEAILVSHEDGKKYKKVFRYTTEGIGILDSQGKVEFDWTDINQN